MTRAASDHVDHFVPVPLRFFEALTAGDLDATHVMVGVLIAHRCYEVKNTAGGVATVRLTTLADLCGVSDDTIERKLDGLRASGWIDLERPKQGQRIGWRIWLRGLSLDRNADTSSVRPPHHLRTTSAKDPPPVRKSSSAEAPGGEGAIPHGKRDRSSAPPPQVDSAEPTNETRRDERRKPLWVGGDVLGKSTEADFDRYGTGRMLAALAALDDDGPPVRVEVADDGSLTWSGDPQEGEQGFLDDCQALVDAGLATWLEGPA
jgi:hypothetical protein